MLDLQIKGNDEALGILGSIAFAAVTNKNQLGYLHDTKRMNHLQVLCLSS